VTRLAIVDLPLPDCPTSAMLFPLGTLIEKFLSTKSSSYLNETLFNEMSEVKSVFTMAFGLSSNTDSVSKISKILSAAAFPAFTL
jgi:hypothetical protein